MGLSDSEMIGTILGNTMKHGNLEALFLGDSLVSTGGKVRGSN